MMKLVINSSSKKIFESDNVKAVQIPGTEGEIGVLPSHSSLITTLEIGEVKIKTDSEEKIIIINGGFAQINDDQIYILADEAELTEELTKKGIEEAIKMAEEKLSGTLLGSEILQLEKQIRYQKLKQKLFKSR